VQVLGKARGMDKVIKTFVVNTFIVRGVILRDALPVFHLFFLILDSLEAVNKNRKIILVALYFLIWGEAANIRFLPECLCYIFHNVSPFLTQVLFFLFCSFRETTSGNEFSMAYTLCRWYCQVDDYD